VGGPRLTAQSTRSAWASEPGMNCHHRNSDHAEESIDRREAAGDSARDEARLGRPKPILARVDG